MTVDMPFDRDVDREHLERHRAKLRRGARRVEIKNELRRGSGVVYPGRRSAGSPPPTERIAIKVTAGELARIEHLAGELHLSVPALIRACVLTYGRKLEGQL